MMIFHLDIVLKQKKNFKKYNFNNHECKYYIRILVNDKKGVLSKIASIFARNNISVRNLVQKPKNNLSNIVVITHYAKEINVIKAMRSFTKNKSIFKKAVLIRIRDQNKL